MNIFTQQRNEHQRRAFNRGVEMQVAGVIGAHLTGWYLVGWEWAATNLKPQQVRDIREWVEARERKGKVS